MSYIHPAHYPVVKTALQRGFKQHEIAAYLRLNQGRISEFKRSELYMRVTPAETLPDDFPYPT